MQYKIVADSSCDLPDDVFIDENCRFSTVPLCINLGNQSFVDDANLSVPTMLQAMKQYKGASSSACPSPQEYADHFAQADCSFAITISNKLSGSYNSAMQGARIIAEQFPAKKVHVVDSLATSTTMGLIAFKLREYIGAKAYDFETIVKKIETYRDSLNLFFIIQSFDNLVKGGRMSKIAGVMANVLSIRPICGENGKGEIKIYEKVRGAKSSLTRMVELMGEKGPVDNKPVFISHCDNLEDANFVKDVIMRLYNPSEVRMFNMRGLASYYAGHKGVIVSC